MVSNQSQVRKWKLVRKRVLCLLTYTHVHFFKAHRTTTYTYQVINVLVTRIWHHSCQIRTEFACICRNSKPSFPAVAQGEGSSNLREILRHEILEYLGIGFCVLTTIIFMPPEMVWFLKRLSRYLWSVVTVKNVSMLLFFTWAYLQRPLMRIRRYYMLQ